MLVKPHYVEGGESELSRRAYHKERSTCKYEPSYLLYRYLSLIIIQASHPETIVAIRQTLLSIQQAGAALDMHQIRGIVVAQIEHSQPDLFRTVVCKDGSLFTASPEWMQNF